MILSYMGWLQWALYFEQLEVSEPLTTHAYNLTYGLILLYISFFLLYSSSREITYLYFTHSAVFVLTTCIDCSNGLYIFR